MGSHTPRDPVYSPVEEKLNVAASLVGAIGALIFLPFLLHRAGQSLWPHALLGAWLFCGGMMLMNGASALYHALPAGKNRSRAQILDHASIFILIASTYSPFALGPLWESGGKILLTIEWGLAVVGIGFKILGGIRYRKLSNLFYLCMGWMGLLWAPAFVRTVSLEGFLWVIGGGVAYTAGIIFYAAKGRPFTHAIWHVFVLAGAILHAYAIWRYAL